MEVVLLVAAQVDIVLLFRENLLVAEHPLKVYFQYQLHPVRIQ